MGSLAETTRSGPGRLLIAVYGIFALAASARSGVQLATRFGDAPLAYLLSALAAAVYVVATLALAGVAPRRVAYLACGVELAGVVLVGAASLLLPGAFPDATVWSDFGRGYGFVPLALPVLGLLWLRHTDRVAAGDRAA
ncbi:hypothetical protein [Saccharothrix longispora]|uniref:hypothetical protein n=1 Tax=Saccharothrix longispora TaxID=33920 RepID=UPI0028FD4439|nr:hypothetical protein [Saccharothrix longispora]MBY8850434.1 hypothetical protein [Saccharothrix sp. MB29]MDU0287993.1 hypothetical protein [Saccharothrix longispora]